ncbi:MAG: porin family protein [Holosporales bacterium]|jgi:opacity protein-like surface antigen|nr:porin family protein [Holosporales bacterium]
MMIKKSIRIIIAAGTTFSSMASTGTNLIEATDTKPTDAPETEVKCPDPDSDQVSAQNADEVQVTGFYVGGNFGASNSKVIQKKDNQKKSDKRNINKTGPLFGILCGYDFQIKNWLFCLESSLMIKPAKNSKKKENGFSGVNVQRKYSVEIPAKFGYIFNKGYVLYALGGIEYSLHKLNDNENKKINSKRGKFGLILGVGIERRFDTFFLGVEIRNAFRRNIAPTQKHSNIFARTGEIAYYAKAGYRF